MNKAILIPIQPEPVAKILNGDKTVLICKTAPKCDLPIDVYIYCTKGNIGAWFIRKMKRCFFGKFVKPMLNGKVVAKFTLGAIGWFNLPFEKWSEEEINFVESKSMVNREEMKRYLKGKRPYLWHISDLVIFDEPKELREFRSRKYYSNCMKCPYNGSLLIEDTDACKHGCEEWLPLAKAPRNWRYVEVE